MKKLCVLCMIMIMSASIAVSAKQAGMNKLTPGEKMMGWRLLFDGETLNGWRALGKPEGWGVEDDAIINLTRGGSYLYTEKRFGDFTLSLDFMIAPHTNSGIFFRWDNLADPVHAGIELQILDSYGKEHPDTNDCGAVYDIMAPRVNACRPAGEWNEVVLNCRDNLIWITMNGERIIHMDLNRWATAGQNPDGTENKFRTAYKDMTREGHIGFQDYGGKVLFRNIKIREF